MGPIIIELYWQHAPETCRNFAELSRRGYYNSNYPNNSKLNLF